jgi:5'(3')-deoxyribonucleotidase
MKIACDVDGTLMKTTSFICSLINFRHGTNFSFKDVNSWDFWQKNGFEKDFYEAYNFLDEFGRGSIQPYDEHTLSSLGKINSFDNEFGRLIHLDFVTANNSDSEVHIRDWITNNKRPYLGPYWINCLGRTTCDAKLALDYDLYIDDNPELAIKIKDYPNKKLLLPNCPWNKNIKDCEQVARFESWNEVPILTKRKLDI